MNRERARTLLPIIQAFADGKDVQFRFAGCGDKPWIDMQDSWNFNTDTADPDFIEYRIKPEPREFWVHRDLLKYSTRAASSLDEINEDYRHYWIKVREVIE